ncbi:MAG TPA: hypothetical protein VFV83_09290, partial [Chthoniobacteraceae bacterium]|nr:hypothetical protein [Chthoniobacteraceae bacterium]
FLLRPSMRVVREIEALAAIARLRNAAAESRRLIAESCRLKQQIVSLIRSTEPPAALWKESRHDEKKRDRREVG